MTLTLPDIDGLRPQYSHGLYLFPSASTGLVKLDLLFEAGSAYQHKKLCASATVKLMTTATKRMDSAALAEFMDYRGIMVEADSQVQQTSLTFWFLRRYADELLPVVRDILTQPAFNEDDYNVWREHRRQEIMSAEQKPSTMARREFYRCLFGEEHPLGAYATASDLDYLTIDDIRAYHAERYTQSNMTVVLAGAVDNDLVEKVRKEIGVNEEKQDARGHFNTVVCTSANPKYISLQSATQTNIRIGRILPIRWDGEEYAQFMLLVMVLGGYFGSRLMQNLREDKGYTYGIYARTQIYRDVIVLFITADVSGGVSTDAIKEVKKELARLCTELIPDEELRLVKNVMVGDFLRSVDGIFERSARFCDMYATCVTEQLTENIQRAIEETTPEHLQQLAAKYLQPDDMLVCTAGV